MAAPGCQKPECRSHVEAVHETCRGVSVGKLRRKRCLSFSLPESLLEAIAAAVEERADKVALHVAHARPLRENGLERVLQNVLCLFRSQAERSEERRAGKGRRS